MKKLTCMLAASALAFGAAAIGATSPAELAKQAKVQMPQARDIALRAYPGKIVKEELEQEKGGSGLRYSFDITSGKVTHEVGVDARTGTVLENSVEGTDKD
ncbi:MAG: PepSY domain-containing protein [Rhodanobacter sp.]